jgi:hypothetical protein
MFDGCAARAECTRAATICAAANFGEYGWVSTCRLLGLHFRRYDDISGIDRAAAVQRNGLAAAERRGFPHRTAVLHGSVQIYRTDFLFHLSLALATYCVRQLPDHRAFIGIWGWH